MDLANKPALRYGLLSGALISVVLFIPYLLWGSRYDFELSLAFGYAGLLLPLSGCIFMGIRHRREREFQGRIPFNSAFYTGLSITLVAALCTYFVIYLFLELNGATWMNRYYEHQRAWILEHQPVPEKAQAALDVLDQQMRDNATDNLNVNTQASMMFFIILLLGGIISAASAAIQRRS